MRGLGQMKIEKRQIKAKKARVWHASLRLWMWRWQTLSPEDRTVFHKQQKFGITYHFAWVLGLDWGEKGNFEKTDYLLHEHSKIKHFDAPYLLTMSAQNGGWVRYQILPAPMHGHRIDIVYYDIEVNPDGSRVKYPSGLYYCVDCKLMGSVSTMKEYVCFSKI